MLTALDDIYKIDFSVIQQTMQFPLRLVCRRLNNALNSAGREMIASSKPYNATYMHPDDMLALGLEEGARIEIISPHDNILGVAESDATLKLGVVSMSHSFGGVPGKDSHEFMQVGSNTGRLISVEENFDALTGIPQMSNIPVRIQAITLD
jgi:anaerobic selenocysteine-containing dehydrogenase